MSKAIALNSNSAYAFITSALLHTCRGESDTAIEQLDRAARLSPMDTTAALSDRNTALAMAHFVAERYDVALGWTERALQERTNFCPTLRFKAACLGRLGRCQEGRQAIVQLLALSPHETMESVRAHYALMFKRPGSLDALLDGLRRVGLPQ